MQRSTKDRDALIRRLNLIPIAAMCIFYFTPMLQYWLAVWGSLRPFNVSPVSAPSWEMFSLGIAVCIAVWWLPRPYFDVKPIERRGELYRRLGVRFFKRYATNGDVINKHVRRLDPSYQVIHGAESMRIYEESSQQVERAHRVLFVAGVLSACHATYIGWYWWATFLAVGNVVFNFYPVLLQRYSRARIARVLRIKLPAAESAGDKHALTL